MINFEAEYQAQFKPLEEKYPSGMKVFANGKVYTVTEWFFMGDKGGVVVVDNEGAEMHLLEGSFEIVQYKTCGRCGGSGRYSHNLKDGSRCYGCSGVGKQTLAPTGFPQKLKGVCSKDLPKFNYQVGDKVKAEFIGFSKTGGTPLYHVTKTNGVANNLMYSTFKKFF
jgi:hypothetical protein